MLILAEVPQRAARHRDHWAGVFLLSGAGHATKVVLFYTRPVGGAVLVKEVPFSPRIIQKLLKRDFVTII